jgi:hypothetical protein
MIIIISLFFLQKLLTMLAYFLQLFWIYECIHIHIIPHQEKEEEINCHSNEGMQFHSQVYHGYRKEYPSPRHWHRIP